jgi:excisionase family DNA binding protein
MVTAVLEKSEENTYQNTYGSTPQLNARQKVCPGAFTKVKSLTASVRWFQKINPLIFLNFQTTRDRIIMKQPDVKSENLSKFLYSVPETATLLSCSRGTIYKLMNEREILAVYPTTKARISGTSIVNYVKRLEEKARDADRGTR